MQNVGYYDSPFCRSSQSTNCDNSTVFSHTVFPCSETKILIYKKIEMNQSSLRPNNCKMYKKIFKKSK